MKNSSVEPARARLSARLRLHVSERVSALLQKNRAPGRPNEPIGMLPDGTLNVVKIDDPPFKPTVYDDLGVPVLNPDRDTCEALC